MGINKQLKTRNLLFSADRIESKKDSKDYKPIILNLKTKSNYPPNI